MAEEGRRARQDRGAGGSGLLYRAEGTGCKIAKLIKDGNHLTVEGLSLIREIKSGMNRGRDTTNI